MNEVFSLSREKEFRNDDSCLRFINGKHESRRGGGRERTEDPFNRSITTEYLWNSYETSLIVVGTTRPRVKIICSRDRSWSRTRSSMQTGSNGLSPVRESRWEIKLMTVKFHIRLWITRYDVPDAEANDTHRWGGWTGMEVRLQLGLGERWFNQPWNLQLCQLWKLSSSVNEASDETTCNVLATPIDRFQFPIWSIL